MNHQEPSRRAQAHCRVQGFRGSQCLPTLRFWYCENLSMIIYIIQTSIVWLLTGWDGNSVGRPWSLKGQEAVFTVYFAPP